MRLPILLAMAAALPSAVQAQDDAYLDDEDVEAAYEEAQDDAYPADEVLGAFATACSGIEVPEVAQASLQAAGWETIEPAADSVIGQIVTFGQEAMDAENAADPDGPQGRTTHGSVHRKLVAGRELFAIVSGVSFGSVAAYGCRVYDLNAPATLTGEQLKNWAVRDPQVVPTFVPGATKHTWNPGLKPGHMEMEVSFVPAGTRFPPPLEDIPITGLVMIASAMEFLDS